MTDRDLLRRMLPGLDGLLVLDAASFGRIIASRPDVWDILRAYLGRPAEANQPALDVLRLARAIDAADDGGCGDPDCCGVKTFPDAAAIAREYAALGDES